MGTRAVTSLIFPGNPICIYCCIFLTTGNISWAVNLLKCPQEHTSNIQRFLIKLWKVNGFNASSIFSLNKHEHHGWVSLQRSDLVLSATESDWRATGYSSSCFRRTPAAVWKTVVHSLRWRQGGLASDSGSWSKDRKGDPEQGDRGGGRDQIWTIQWKLEPTVLEDGLDRHGPAGQRLETKITPTFGVSATEWMLLPTNEMENIL